MRLRMKVLVLAASGLIASVASDRSWSDCQPSSVGVDTSQATSATATALGDAVGEVFYAPDTLVTAVTIWRQAFLDSNIVGLKLYVANVDSTGRPIPQSLVLDGPTVYHILGDGIHPTPFRFEFNPPLVLPHRGTYEFAFQSRPCGSSFFFIYNNTNALPQGSLWWHGQTSNSGCRLRTGPQEYPTQDLVFEVEFCQSATPTLSETWGHLKHVYR